MNRRQFFRVCGIGLGGSNLEALRMAPTGAFVDQVRHFKLVHTVETRSTCIYYSVGYDLIMYGQGDGVKNVTQNIIHIRGDVDHSINRDTFCLKGAGLLDYIHSPNHLKYPEVHEAGSSEWKRTEWDEALERIAKLMKEDRDANFVEKNEQSQTVNHWLVTGSLAAPVSSSEADYTTHKAVRSLGTLRLGGQARV